MENEQMMNYPTIYEGETRDVEAPLYGLGHTHEHWQDQRQFFGAPFFGGLAGGLLGGALAYPFIYGSSYYPYYGGGYPYYYGGYGGFGGYPYYRPRPFWF